MNKIHIKDYYSKKIHFIGIGGISMSALAQILLSRGCLVSGSDVSDSDMCRRLASLGIKVYIGHSADNIDGVDLIVYTAAIKHDNPEMVEAQLRKLPILQRAELLGQIMQTYSHSLAISGSHGKTTTTSMISMAMVNAGLDPTVLLGGELNDIGGNVRIGNSTYFISEACEYVGSFLHFNPYLAIVLNIDLDHLDYFRDIGHIYATFSDFVKLIPLEGFLIGNIDDDLVEQIMDEVKCNVFSYGINKNADLFADKISFDNNGCAIFDIICQGQYLGRINLRVPGLHNIYNSLATFAALKALGVTAEDIFSSIEKYKGTKRRFEIKGTVKGITIVDDYAHHPAEIKATLATAGHMEYKNRWCVFQPHTYTRTKMLLKDFSTAFNNVENIIITDIYSARELDTIGIHSRHLADAISETGKHCLYISSFDEIIEYLQQHAKDGDLIITMGAGDIHIVGEKLISMF